ncbi:MAG: DNA cytosine methyltransferase [Bacteroidia bacterium]
MLTEQINQEDVFTDSSNAKKLPGKLIKLLEQLDLQQKGQLKNKELFITVSLCSGMGGLDLGFEQTGRFITLYAIDNVGHAVDTFRLNFEGTCCELAEINAAMTGQSILDRINAWYKQEYGIELNLQPGDIDVVIGGPPCQDFSMMTRHRNIQPEESEKINLFYECVRIAKELGSKTFVFENVPAMLQGEMAPTGFKVMNSFTDSGYYYNYKELCGVHYGMPSSRRRLFFVAVQQELKQMGILPVYPKPDLAGAEHLRIKDIFPYIEYICTNQFSNKLLGRDKFCPTITRSTALTVFTQGQWRNMSIEEALRFQSFPADYKFPDNRGYAEKHARIGNSVGPAVAKAVAECVANDMLDKYYQMVAEHDKESFKMAA